jgi:hypothetical protein
MCCNNLRMKPRPCLKAKLSRARDPALSIRVTQHQVMGLVKVDLVKITRQESSFSCGIKDLLC